jgi:hypothetical protein
MSDCYANWSEEALLDSQQNSLYARAKLMNKKKQAMTESLVDEAANITAEINKLQAIFQELTPRKRALNKFVNLA